MKTAIAVLFFINITLSAFSQNNLVKIKLQIWHSLRIENNEIMIEVYKEDSLFLVSVKSFNKKMNKRYPNIDTSYVIDSIAYFDIINSIKSIDIVKLQEKLLLSKEATIGMDGETCKLMFGTPQNNISLLVWSPEADTKKRGLDSFVYVCKKILKLAKLNPKELLK